MKIIGITGKSGSGKTHVANIIANQLNATLICFDKISHQTLETDEIKSFVKENFGIKVFTNGKIDRKKLGNIAFNDPQKLEKLNKIAETLMEKIIDENLKNTNSEYVVFEYMLLPKMKYFDMCDLKILTTASDEIRNFRVLLRDGISKEYYDKRERNSLDFSKYHFDIVFENNSINEESIYKLANEIKNWRKL